MTEMWENEDWKATPKGVEFVKNAEKFWGISFIEWYVHSWTGLIPSDSNWEETLSEYQSQLEESQNTENIEYYYGSLLVGGFVGLGSAQEDFPSFPVWVYWMVQKGYIYEIEPIKIWLNSLGDYNTLSQWNISDINDLGSFMSNQYYTIKGYSANDISNNPDLANDLNPLGEYINDMFSTYHFVEWDYAEDGSDVYFEWAGGNYGSSGITPSDFKNQFFVQTENQTDSCFYVATNISGISSISGIQYLLVATIDLSKYSVKLEGFEYPIDLTIVNKTEFDTSLKNVFSVSRDNTLDVYTFKDQSVGSALYTFLENNNNSDVNVYIYPA